MKVLHTNFLRGWGGQSNRILTECVGLAARGWQVLLSVPPGSELAKRARTAGLAVDESISYGPLVRALLAGDVRNFTALVERFQPDIIHLHGGRDSWIAALALGWRQKRPLILRTKHNVFPIIGHPLNRCLYGRFFDGIVCISSSIVKQCADTRYISPEKLVLIPSACDAERFARATEAREKKREEFGFHPSDVVIVMSGRFRPEKGHDILLAAAPHILEALPNVKFLLLGSGSLQGTVEARLRAQGLFGSIVLAGFRSDVAECLAAADLAVQPSRSEGLGTAVLEASAIGLPVVATAVGGIPDIVVHGETGLLVPPEDPEALAQALIQLAQNPEQRAALGRAAQQRVATLFSVERLIELTDNYYRRLLGL
ncbi:MAG: glycosyltransferase family 4 protein [Candidatus Sumerlaeaceae bacterium]|jgi:glycosyltransferase involved in cell wall biosynthesis